MGGLSGGIKNWSDISTLWHSFAVAGTLRCPRRTLHRVIPAFLVLKSAACGSELAHLVDDHKTEQD